MARHSRRTVTTLQEVTHLTLKVYRCRNAGCPRFRSATQPEEEGRWALPHGEFGLDVIALVGTLRYQEQRSIPQIHQELQRRGVQIASRTVTDQLYRYEELLALHLADPKRLQERLGKQEQVILALDGLQPDVGHEVLWVLRDCCSGEVLLACSLLGATEQDLVPLLLRGGIGLPSMTGSHQRSDTPHGLEVQQLPPLLCTRYTEQCGVATARLHTVVEEENTETAYPFILSVSWAVPCPLDTLMPHAKGRMAHNLRLAPGKQQHPPISRLIPWERTHTAGGFS